MLVSERLQVLLCALPSAVVSGFSACFVKMQFPRRQGGTWGAEASPQGLVLWSLLGHPTGCGRMSRQPAGSSVAPASPGEDGLCPWGRERLPSPLFPETGEHRGALCCISTVSVFW